MLNLFGGLGNEIDLKGDLFTNVGDEGHAGNDEIVIHELDHGRSTPGDLFAGNRGGGEATTAPGDSLCRIGPPSRPQG